MTLDTKDKKILSLLDLDARLPLSAIAKKVCLSREVVHYRIQQLEKRGIIEGYYTALDITKLGLLFCRFFIKYRHMSPQKEKEFIEFVKKDKYAVWGAVGEGTWDFTFAVLGKSLEEIENFSDKLHAEFGQHLQKSAVSIASRIYHFKHKFLYNDKDTRQEILGEKIKTKINFDDKDLKILRTIADNARLSLVDIAKKTKLSSKVINYRLKQLTKNKIILGFRAKINTRLLGFDHYKVFLHLEKFTKANKDKLIWHLRHAKEVIYITKPLGSCQLEFEVMVQNANQLHEFIRSLRAKFSDMITDYNTSLFYHTPFLKYLPDE